VAAIASRHGRARPVRTSRLTAAGPLGSDRIECRKRTAGEASGGGSMADYTPYQQKIIKRYYKNFDEIKHQRLSELATELYLAEGKKRDRLWGQVEQTLRKLEFPETRIAHLLEKRDPALLVGVLKELAGGA
jgi:hypothetical protein